MTDDEIRKARVELDLAAFNQRKELGRKIASEQSPRRCELYKACAELGHIWRFQHFGPLGNSWYVCPRCHLKEARDNDL